MRHGLFAGRGAGFGVATPPSKLPMYADAIALPLMAGRAGISLGGVLGRSPRGTGRGGAAAPAPAPAGAGRRGGRARVGGAAGLRGGAPGLATGRGGAVAAATAAAGRAGTARSPSTLGRVGRAGGVPAQTQHSTRTVVSIMHDTNIHACIWRWIGAKSMGGWQRTDYAEGTRGLDLTRRRAHRAPPPRVWGCR